MSIDDFAELVNRTDPAAAAELEEMLQLPPRQPHCPICQTDQHDFTDCPLRHADEAPEWPR